MTILNDGTIVIVVDIFLLCYWTDRMSKDGTEIYGFNKWWIVMFREEFIEVRSHDGIGDVELGEQSFFVRFEEFVQTRTIEECMGDQ